MSTHSATVTAPGGRSLPAPADMPAHGRLVSVSWEPFPGHPMRYAGHGFWWTRSGAHLVLDHTFDPGTAVTVTWED